MKSFFTYLLILIVFSIILISCKKDDEPKVLEWEGCRLSKSVHKFLIDWMYKGDTSYLYTTYHYNLKNQLIEIEELVDPGIHKVTQCKYNDLNQLIEMRLSRFDIRHYEYDAESHWIKSVSKIDDVTFTVSVQYDTNGNRSEINYSRSDKKDTGAYIRIFYSYADDNLVRSVSYTQSGDSTVTNFAYYADRENKNMVFEELFAPYNGTGTPSKHMLKSATIILPSKGPNTQIKNYSYVFDSNGYPIKRIYNHKSDYGDPFSQVLEFQYDCK